LKAQKERQNVIVEVSSLNNEDHKPTVEARKHIIGLENHNDEVLKSIAEAQKPTIRF
jgi:hypothetical protein